MKELDFRLALDRVLRGWKTLVTLAIACSIIAIILLPFQRPLYAITMTVVPAPSEQVEGSGAATGALTSLLGLSGGSENSTYARYQKLLVLPIVAQRMEDRYGMLRFVFSSNWDSRDQKWVPTPTLRSTLTAPLLTLAHVPTWSPPDAVALAKYMEGNLLIVPSTQNDIVTITMNNTDVPFAKRLMLAAHEQANAILRDQVAHRARQQVAYLQQKLGETTVADYRATLLAILSSQEKTLMLTQTDAPYAAEILSPPTASQTPISPRPVLYLFVSLLIGLIIGATLVIFLGPDWWREALKKLRDLVVSRRKRQTAPGY